MVKNNLAVERLVETIIDRLEDGFGPEDIMPIIAAAVESVESLQLTGASKKQIVTDAVAIVVDKYILDPAVATVINAVVPRAIDTAVTLAKSEFMRRARRRLCCFGG